MKRKDFKIPETSVLFKDKSDAIRDLLKTKDFDSLKRLYKASDKVVLKSLDYFQKEEQPTQALNLYDGLVFKQLEIKEYSETQMKYLQEHVIILSAMYGALRSSDMILEYRLDYFMPFDMNLYEYWKEDLSQYFESDELIINLASQEFSDSFSHNNVININFVNQEGKTLSTAAKMARGDMLNYLITENILDLEGIKKYNNLHYRFDEHGSNENNLIFVMEEV